MEETSILLQELRCLRNEVQEFKGEVLEWRQAIGERTAALEVIIKRAILGNGQPSDLKQLDNRITVLERGHWRMGGMLVACSAVLSVASAFAIEYVKKLLGH